MRCEFSQAALRNEHPHFTKLLAMPQDTRPLSPPALPVIMRAFIQKHAWIII